MGKLQGKIAVITGGTTGIGLASAKRFVAEGAFIYIFGRRKDALDAAVAELGQNARGVQGDISKLEDLDRLFEAVKAGVTNAQGGIAREVRPGSPAPVMGPGTAAGLLRPISPSRRDRSRRPTCTGLALSRPGSRGP